MEVGDRACRDGGGERAAGMARIEWLCGCLRGRGRRDEAIAATGDGGYVLWPARMVLQLDAQVADVAVNHIALGHIVDPPEVVQNLVAGEQASRVCGQEIEQALVERRGVQLRFAGPDTAGEDSDLQIAQPPY